TPQHRAQAGRRAGDDPGVAAVRRGRRDQHEGETTMTTATTTTPRPSPGTRPLPLAALYIRVSSEKQRDNYSPETQEDDCRACAARKGYAVSEAHVYRETHTATDLWERPELTRARAAIARGE